LLFKAGNAALASGNFVLAVSLFDALKKKYPLNLSARYARIKICRAQKDRAGEEKELMELSGLRPQDASLFQQLFQLAYEKKDLVKARRYLTSILVANGKLNNLELDDYIQP
jgi:Tfp pilus assembly protein PilF